MEEQMTLAERLEEMLAVLEQHHRKTGQAYAPATIEYLLKYFVRTDMVKRSAVKRAEQMGMVDPEASGKMDPALARVAVKALMAGTGLFPQGPDRQALYLLYGLDGDVPVPAARVAETLNMRVYTVRRLDQKFRNALRPRLHRRKRIRDFYA